MNPAPLSSASAAAFPPPRIAPHLGHALGGIFRLTLRRYSTARHWVILVILLGVLTLLLLGNVRHRAGPESFFTWTILFYLSFLVPAFSFDSAAGAIRDDLKSSSTDYVLTRPIPRPAFIGFRYLAHVACTQLDLLLAFSLVIALGFERVVPGLTAAIPQLLLAQLLMVTAFSAFGFLCGVLTSRYVIVGLLYGAVVELGFSQMPTQLSRLSMTQQMRNLLHAFVEQPSAAAAPLGPWAATGIVLVFTLVMLALTVGVFSLRELLDKNDA